MKNLEINKEETIALKLIYEEIFKKINNQYIDVFLCGGAKTKHGNHIRDMVRSNVEEVKNIRVLYPEDLFAEILNTDKESNLLSLEKFLANNSDIICIICESPGSLVELGAFVNNEETFSKVVAVIEKKYTRDKSFIMQGPIKMICKNNKDNVIYYNKNEVEQLSDDIKKVCSKRYRITSKAVKTKPLNTIIGIYNFIPLLLYFYKNLEFSDLSRYLNYIITLDKLDKKLIDIMINSSLKLLFKDKYIVKQKIDEKNKYLLTDKGYKNINHILENLQIKDKTRLYDRVRFGIIYEKYYKKPRLA